MENLSHGGMNKGIFIARIDPDDPMKLFMAWHYEANRFDARALNICCMATVSKDLKATSRNMILRGFDQEGFTVMTDARSRKVNDIEHNPNAAMCFLWEYSNSDCTAHKIVRQVTIEGKMRKLSKTDCQKLYDIEPWCCKLRAHVCHQDQPVEWNALNSKYQEMLKLVHENKKDLSMPDHIVAYKLLPEMIEFYHAREKLIADRLRFWRKEPTERWEYQRIAA